MAKLALEPDCPPGGPGSQGPRASPSSGQPPSPHQSLQPVGLSRHCMGEAEAARTQIKAQEATFIQPLLREGPDSGTSPPCLSLRPSEPSRPLSACCLQLGESLEKRWALLAGG